MSHLQRLGHIARNLAFRTPLVRQLCHRYPYSFEPAQLAFLLECIDRTAALPGPIFEVGCFRGATTVWICRHLETRGLRKQYLAIDTFEGFVSEQVSYEISNRKMTNFGDAFNTGFSTNSQRLVRETLRQNGAEFVQLVQGDAATFDYSVYSNVSFALIDVDLYVPVKKVLEHLYERMAPGGIIVVDDCVAGGPYDGALDAYREFTESHQLPFTVVHRKMGIIEMAVQR